MTRIPIGAKIVICTCLRVKSSETVLIVTDPPFLCVAKILARAARAVGAETVILIMNPRTRHGEEPPKLVKNAMCVADVVLTPTTYSLSHTIARKQACNAGARIALMHQLTESMLRQGAIFVDYSKLNRLTHKISTLLSQASEIEVTSPAGTELVFSIVGREGHADTGILHKPGDFGNLPAGEAFIAPLEGSADGDIIIDGPIVTKTNDEVYIKVKNGMAITIRGSKKLVKMLDKVGPKARNLAEFGIGTNPKAEPLGHVLEGEKALGTCHIALGDNSTFGGRVRAGIHVDGIFLRPTVKLDGKILMQNGRLKL